MDDYLLNRDYLASVRLNSQHALWRNIFGWILHPKIESTLKEDAEIGDVGCGTGVFLLELASTLKVKMVGMDNSAAQFCPSEWLPPNVEFRVVDALRPPPADLRGRFDSVSANFLLAIIKEDPIQLINHFHQLLKPGGYLQWGEPMTKGYTVEGKGDALQILASSINTGGLSIGKSQLTWLVDLPDTLGKHGFEIIVVERRSPKPWFRGWWIDNFICVHREAGRIDEGVLSKASAEWKTGSWIESEFQCIIARKNI